MPLLHYGLKNSDDGSGVVDHDAKLEDSGSPTSETIIWDAAKMDPII